MCGIVGYWSTAGDGDEQAIERLRAMSNVIRHRGPDDAGQWYDAGAGLALGHRRLSIVDLSVEGHQPMSSPTGRYMMVFNGEVYNFRRLRAELEASGGALGLRGGSDTELMLAAIEHWGLTAAVRRFIGMFAFALWDKRERRLHLVRDRLGVKPLCYSQQAGTLLFASELRALTRHPSFVPDIDVSALRDYLRLGYVAAPATIYRNAHKVQPGTILTFTRAGQPPSLERYWSAAEAVSEARQRPFAGNLEEATDALEALLSDAIGLRMIADVPLGAFLSGGIDSSVVVALMQRQGLGKVRTFSIGNEAAAYDEAPAAEAVARHLGTEHTTFRVTDAQAVDVAPRLGQMFDEPFADSSQIPTFLVSQLARSHVTVALSGDGGDELFGGYNRHIWAPTVMRAIGALPRGLRLALAAKLTKIPTASWDRLYASGAQLLPKLRLPGDKVHKLASVLAVDTTREMYDKLCAQWRSPMELIRAEHRSGLLEQAVISPPQGLSFAEQMMFLDLVTYLPDDILTKVDRASMAVGLEAREPLLDHRVVELAWSFPQHLKIQGSTGKRVLRNLLARYLPPGQLSRAKMGFGVPVATWLRGPLQDWARALLSRESLERSGLLAPEPIEQALRQHLGGERDRTQELWTALMFVSWHESRNRADLPS